MRKEATRHRHFPLMSNPKVQRGLLKLRIAIKFKFRRRDFGRGWREKFNRAIKRCKGIIKISKACEEHHRLKEAGLLKPYVKPVARSHPNAAGALKSQVVEEG